MLPAYISHPDCLKHAMGDQHPECPERIGAVSDMLLIKGLLDFMQPCEAPLATEQQLAQAHSSLYIHSIAAQSPKHGTVQVDPETIGVVFYDIEPSPTEGGLFFLRIPLAKIARR